MEQRKIKFKCLYRDKWYTVSELHMYPDGSIGIGGFEGSFFAPDADHIKCIVQHTGLKDKNGEEIYEGDIFQVAGNRKYEVRYSEGGTSNHEWYGGAFVLWLNEEAFFPFDEFAMKNGEIIGNIYENKDLLT